jgi:hypothetical protein
VFYLVQENSLDPNIHIGHCQLRHSIFVVRTISQSLTRVKANPNERSLGISQLAKEATG